MARRKINQSSRSCDLPSEWRKLFELFPGGYDPDKTKEDCWFSPEIADAACEFFPNHLKHVEGEWAGKPLILEGWQKAIIGCAFGWFTPTGKRRYREVFQFIPRKNAKTTMLAGLVNLVGFCDGEPGAQLYSAAADREQASLIYRVAKGMILQSPWMSGNSKVYATYKSIEFPANGVYKALSSDADTKHGFNSHFVAVDELHAHRSRDLVDVLVTSTGARSQPLVWYITTADFDRPSICNEKYEYACRVRDGLIADKGFLPIVYEAPKGSDWRSEETWKAANPNYGISVKRDYLARECQRAQEVPSYENTFKRLHLNIRTQTDVKWLDIEKFDLGNREVIEAALADKPCWGGLDTSTTTDLTAFARVWPVGNEYIASMRFYAPRANAEKRQRRDRVPYLTWAQQGYLTLTDGDVVDYDFIRNDVRDIAGKCLLQDVAFDPWNATQLATQLMGDGIQMIQFRQGFTSMTEPAKEFEKLVTSGRLIHGGNPILRWMAGNAVVETDAAGNIKPSKKKSTERIDGVVSVVMAIGRAMIQKTSSSSVYESRGVLVL